MPSQTNEASLEACIERHLAGGSEIALPGSKTDDGEAPYQTGKGAGYLRGSHSDFNAEFAINDIKFRQFLVMRIPESRLKRPSSGFWLCTRRASLLEPSDKSSIGARCDSTWNALPAFRLNPRRRP